MVRPRDIHQATIQVQQRGLPMQRPLFDTSETDIIDSDHYDCTTARVETPTLHDDLDSGPLIDPHQTTDNLSGQHGPRKRARIVMEEEEDDEDDE